MEVDPYAYDGSLGTGSNLTSGLATVTASAFDKVVFGSDSNAFKSAQLSIASVPLSAGGLLLLGALDGIAALHRRKAA